MKFILPLFILSLSLPTFAAVPPFQVRFYYGKTTVEPKDLNTEVKTYNLDEVTSLPKYGLEATFPVTSFVNLGFIYFKRSQTDRNDAIRNYDLEQEGILGVARFPIIKNDFFKWDVFGAAGLGSASLKITTPSGNGELIKNSLITSYGSSAAIGYKKYFLFVEGGIESNKLDSFNRKGTVNNSIQDIDLSGPYVMGGIIIDELGPGK